MKRVFLTISIIFLTSLGIAAQVPTPSPVPSPTPAELPTDVPPIAPNFQGETRPMVSVERVGVDSANQLPLTLEEAIQMALENNNDIDASRNDVQIAEFNLKSVRGVYDPQITAESYFESATTPTSSTIGGGTSNGSVTQRRFFGSAGVSGFTPYAGGSYSALISSSRLTTSNSFATLNPQYPSALTLNYTQPLFRGRRFDINRRNIEIAKKNLSLTDVQFRQKAIDVITQVEQAYWDLAFALRNLQVNIDAVKQARLQLESNQRLVEKGVLAPIEIVAANAQVTNLEQNVFIAQESVTRAENTLKTLMFDDRKSADWARPITPVSEINLETPRVALDIATADALKNRPEIATLDNAAEINQINQRFFRDQTKPEINLVGTYISQGLSGNPTFVSTNPVAPNLVGGYFNSVGNLLQQDYPTYRVGVTINLPFGNTTAKANLGRTLVEETRLGNQRAQTEQLIEAEVRNSVQALRSAEARLNSAISSRKSAELLYESEQRQFRAGTTTLYLVYQRQNELVIARGRELQAQTDLNKAISAFRRATGSTLTANNVTVTDGTNLIVRPNIRQTTRNTTLPVNTKDQ